MRDGSGITAPEFMALTLREIEALNDVREMREVRADFQTARIVAMISAVNGKGRRYDPQKYMLKGNREILERAKKGEKRDPKEGLTGEEILSRFRQMGLPIIDKRAKK